MRRLGEIFARLTQRFLPDAMALACLLTLLVMALAVAFPQAGAIRHAGGLRRVGVVAGVWLDAVWNPAFLTFALQMCVVLLTGFGLARAPLALRGLRRLARMAGSNRGAVFLIGLVSCAGCWINWGFGLVFAGVLAREVRSELSRRGVACQYALIVAAAYSGMMIWHGGFSGSAPLKVASDGVVIESGEAVETIAPISVGSTILSPTNIGLTVVLLAAVPGLLAFMGSKRVECDDAGERGCATDIGDHGDGGCERRGGGPRSSEGGSDGPRSCARGSDGGDGPRSWVGGSEGEGDGPRSCARGSDGGGPRSWVGGLEGGRERLGVTWADRVNESRLLPTLIAVLAVAALVRSLMERGGGAIGLNFVNSLFLAGGLLLHGSLKSYVAAVVEGGQAIVGIVIQFPLYAGIQGVMFSAGLAAAISEGFVEGSQVVAGWLNVGAGETFPIATLLSAGLVNFFVPSGGGQWIVQGPIMCSAAKALSVPIEQTVMAVAYGDQLTNMVQPFWAIPLMGMTRVDAREFMGYCALLMLIAAPVFGVALLLY